MEEIIMQHLLGCKVRHFPVKRVFDVLFSIGAILFFLPIIMLIIIAILLTAPGPILYAQERIGRGGKSFRCYKFRTMYRDAERRLNAILSSDERLRVEWQQTRKLKNDPRVIPVGKFLRRTSLDELPQFWNVIRGELSIVGPRPVVSDEVVQFMGNKAAKILSVRPGLTGIWQVSGRNDTSYTKRLELDEEYVDKRCMLLDIKLILKTIPVMLSSKGAY